MKLRPNWLMHGLLEQQARDSTLLALWL